MTRQPGLSHVQQLLLLGLAVFIVALYFLGSPHA